MRTRRETTRAATIQEIKNTALARMRSEGTVDVKLSDVARDMRMSAPGLYRYFDGREALLSALIVDALTELADRVEKVRDSVAPDDHGGRFLAVVREYREWALADREGFTLVFGPGLSGLKKQHQQPGAVEGPDKAAAVRALDALRSLTRGADAAGVRRPLVLTTLPPSLQLALCDPETHGVGADAPTELAMTMVWASVHGFVTLEANGNFEWHGKSEQEAIFLGLARLLSGVLGLPDPLDGWPAGTPAP